MLIKLLINAFALWFAAWLVDGMHLSENPIEVAIVALVFGLVLLSLPMLLLTLGLFTLVVNAAMLGLAAWFTAGLVIDTFAAAFLGGLVVSVTSLVLSVFKD